MDAFPFLLRARGLPQKNRSMCEHGQKDEVKRSRVKRSEVMRSEVKRSEVLHADEPDNDNTGQKGAHQHKSYLYS